MKNENLENINNDVFMDENGNPTEDSWKTTIAETKYNTIVEEDGGKVFYDYLWTVTVKVVYDEASYKYEPSEVFLTASIG
jgi:hypothetical protein